MEDLQKATANPQVPVKRSPKLSVPKIFKSFKNSVLEDLAMSFSPNTGKIRENLKVS